ncbi:MAG TPA: SDR family NAD(P)-dependent oxidoreductase [Acidimicrobiales bacterium]|nr:SDR family NAD(P)-dependent oxidoreductase [Acidimicrobiales bacterium]
MLRRVLVTGAGSGIGLATAGHLAGLGFAVTGLVPTGEERAALLRLAAERGVHVDVVQADLSDPVQRAGLVAGMDLWALVNNAGYMNAGQIRDVPIDDARRQIETMVLAPVDLARQALPAMVDKGQGRIVNVTSSAVHTSTPLTGWYQACKAALRELNDSLRLELEASGVQVVDIEPGGYRTGIWSGAADQLRARRTQSLRPDLYDRVLSRLDQAEGLMGDPDWVAIAVGKALTTGKPAPHLRIGPGAAWLRALDKTVPDRIWDRVMSRVAGLH